MRKGSKSSKKGSRSLAKLKKRLDAVFSKYIRGKYPARCYTCGKRSSRKRLHCGHFISRTYTATRWEENNCRPQCVGCNIYGDGKFLDFEERLKRDLGEGVVEELKRRRHQVFKVDEVWYLSEIEKYKIICEAKGYL